MVLMNKFRAGGIDEPSPSPIAVDTYLGRYLFSYSFIMLGSHLLTVRPSDYSLVRCKGLSTCSRYAALQAFLMTMLIWDSVVQIPRTLLDKPLMIYP